MISPDVASSDGVLAAEEETNSALRGASGSSTSAEGVSANRGISDPASPPSCAEMKEMLGRIPRALDTDLPSSKMFETVEMVLLRYLLFLPNQRVHHLVDT